MKSCQKENVKSRSQSQSQNSCLERKKLLLLLKKVVAVERLEKEVAVNLEKDIRK